jgi:hypothetical protein
MFQISLSSAARLTHMDVAADMGTIVVADQNAAV